MSYTRLVNRRGTAAQWTASNPILATGEFGFESDTGKFKIGNGSSNWAALEYFVNATALKGEIIDGSPTALDTLNELAEALNDDENFATTVTNAIGLKAPLASPTFTGTVDFSGATVSGVILPINWRGAWAFNQTYAENDLVEYQGSVYYATGPNINSTFIPGVSVDWELFASKGDTGATGAGYLGVTSSTTATVNTGSTTFAVSSTGAYTVGTRVRVSSTASPSNFEEGTVTAVVLNTSITVNVDLVGGSGTFAAWTFSVAGVQGVTGATGGFSSTQTIESGSTRALTSADAGKLITNSAAITITVQGLSIGQQVDFIQTNAAQITFTPGSGITLNSRSNNRKTALQFSPASVKCVAANSYILVGDLAA